MTRLMRGRVHVVVQHRWSTKTLSLCTTAYDDAIVMNE